MRGDHDTFWEWLDDFFALWRVRRWFRYRWQKMTRGWTDEETWSLNDEFARWMLPRLKRFKQLANGYPAHLKPEEWDAIMDKMIRAMETVLYDDDVDRIRFKGLWGDEKREEYDRRWKEVDEGYELLGKYIRHLWW